MSFSSGRCAGERYAFANLATALQEIHQGTHRPYPCGAGGGYFGVSADGALYACHRFVQDESARFGDVWKGVDVAIQERWLTTRHVHRQHPCSGCWARYFCGGGCHHEVIYRGRPACEYIRGWLEFSLKAYVQLLTARSEYFGAA
ncbi:MAG: SPASM domain-containing protein [Acetobacteraceae bacterium]|nr:SPASM domain-containing protein [Acetobacteraceae bacterium]